MIDLSFSSVFMTVIMSNVLLVVITLCFRNENLLKNIGYKLIAVFCVVTLVRLLLPFELPITHTIALPKLISDVVLAVRYPYGTFLGIELSLWTGFCVIWVIGVIVQLLNFANDHRIARNYARTYGTDVTQKEPYASMLKELCTERQLRHIKILETRGIENPMILGLRNSKILLPQNVDVSNADMHYAIKHEIYHYAHHDLWIKSAVNCLVIAYWWNPCSHILNRQINMLLEMRIDDAVMDEGLDQAMAYMASIHRHLIIAKNKQKQKQESAPLCANQMSSLHYRLCIMQRHYDKANYRVCIVMLLFMIGLYIGSYLFIWEANTYKPEMVEPFVTMSDENTYAIDNGDGTYNIYMDEIYLETTDTLEYYPIDIKIYLSEEDYNEKSR